MSQPPKCPRHVLYPGPDDGFDFSDLLKTGITQEQYKQFLLDHLVEGPPKIHLEPVKSESKPDGTEEKKKPKKKAEPNLGTVATDGSVAQRKVAPDPDVGLPPEFSEDALAERFTERFEATMKYCSNDSSWYLWEGNRWIKDDTLKALHNSRQVCKVASTEAAGRLDLGSKSERISNAIATRRMYANVEQIARTDRRHAVRPTDFDADSFVLNTPDGIVELRTGQIRPATKDDLCTKQALCAPGGPRKRWVEFLKWATDDDPELMRYLQRIAGYCLTGATVEQVFFFCYGTGGNGKGTYINTIQRLLNDYSYVAPMDTFIATRFQKHSSEIAMMQGARLVTAQEPDAGVRWNEGRIKSLTGGDPITARHMYAPEFTFLPQFKLLFSGNDKPQLRNVDDAIKRRLYLIPFDRKIAEEDKDQGLQNHLLTVEGGGILEWAIEGCLDWQKYSLQAPDRVRASTTDYFDSEDKLGLFFSECCEIGPGLREQTTRMYQRYREWCNETGEYAVNRRQFTQDLAKRGYPSKNRGGTMQVAGIKLPDRYQPPEF